MKKPTWITYAEDSKAAPLFRREFETEKTVVRAVLRICGLGYHEAWINGQRVSDHVLDPSQTDYERRVLYAAHDVSGMLQQGCNAIGVIVGNGWFNQDRVWSDTGYSYGKPRLWLELTLSYDDKSTETVLSDGAWRYAFGPITDNNIYAGECYDARLESSGWSEVGFDDGDWADAIQAEEPSGEMQEQTMAPMRAIEDITPVGIKRLDGGRYVVDMGQNFSGWARIRIDASAGTEVVMRFAETVFPDGTVDTASTGVFATGVEQVDRYICHGKGVEEWEPRFTYHGFRYVEVTGWPGDLSVADITGVVVHNDLPVVGTFECSDLRLNQLHSMALWTHRSNIHGIPEDCPARERCGWLGDAHLVAEFSMWNYQGKSFWEKYLGDMETSRQGNNGYPTPIAPGKRCQGDANPDWAAALITVPWYVYLFYGDKKVLQDHWQGMQELMQRFLDVANCWILEGGYGDWFDPGSESICQHTSPTLTTTLWFYRCAEIMSATASALGDESEAARYAGAQREIQKAFLGRFYDSEKGSFGSQCADAMALAFGVSPDEERIVSALVEDIEGRDMHLNVGIFGVRFLFEVLTQHGRGDIAMRLMHQNTYPSFGDLIDRGATTLWEYWGEEKIDGTHGPRSLSHPMFGGYENWFYNTLAGIKPDPRNPGFRHFFLQPHPIDGLTDVRAEHVCHFGKIVSSWHLAGKAFEWEVLVPDGCSATATLPGGEVRELDPGEHRLAVELL